MYIQLDALTAARTARKEQTGHRAQSLAENVKLVATRHQHAAGRMEVQYMLYIYTEVFFRANVANLCYFELCKTCPKCVTTAYNVVFCSASFSWNMYIHRPCRFIFIEGDESDSRAQVEFFRGLRT